MRSKNVFAAPIVGLLFLATFSSARAAAPASVPRLVVILVVDQMPADYLDRFSAFFGTGGFARLAREGERFLDARYAYAAPSTGPGHTIIGSGMYPDRSGIVGNTWFSRDENSPVYCADGPVSESDPRRCARPGEPVLRTSASASRPRNPCWLDGVSLAQRVKERWPKARVVGVSIKDRSAILSAGIGADAAYWFDEKARPGRFVSSAFYAASQELLDRWNAVDLPSFEQRLDRPGQGNGLRAAWEYSLARPPRAVCPDDIPSTHTPLYGLGASFPHRVESLPALIFSPLGDEMVAEFARSAVRDYRLGRNPANEPDVLTVSFSSFDNLGHLFGPDACEVADAMARLDRTVERLVRFLEDTVGRRNLVVFLTSDHGVATVPEVARARGLPAGRIFFFDEDAKTVGELPPERRRVELDLARLHGIAVDDSTPLERAIVRSFQEPSVYLNRRAFPAKELPEWRARVRERLLKIEGVKAVHASDEILAGNAPEAVRLEFREDRSGDLLVVLQPNWIFDSRRIPLAANHGQPYDYDVRVPLLVWGGSVRRGSVSVRVDVARIAPTIARLLSLNRAGFSRPDPLPLGPAQGLAGKKEEHHGHGGRP